jgi:imidazolonepropionase-like amidohydrolase
MIRLPLGLVALALMTSTVAAQRPAIGNGVRPFVAVDTTIVAITHVRVIDGTGATPRTDQTIIIRDGRIASIGSSATMQIPAGAPVMDLTAKSVIPGLVMVHEHLTYPTAPGVSGNLIESFSRLYLASGVTSMRTVANVNGLREIQHKKAIDAGTSVGPWMDATAPFIEGPPGMGLDQFYVLKDAADVRTHVAYWTGIGATSLKAYMHLTRDQLRATVEEGHKRGLKVTGHLCSITYREAADLGIDNLEHGFFAATDFVSSKQPDVCPDQGAALQSLATMDASADAMRSLMRHLIEKKVALTSTLTVFESFTPGRPVSPGVELLVPSLRDQFIQTKAQIDRSPNSIFAQLFPKLGAWDVDFFRAGGTLLVGTDPTGIGGVVAGYSNQRALELLVEAGLTPLEAIKVGTLNGAIFLGRGALVGSITVGKQADLVVIDGDPSTRIDDIRKVTLVFKQGVGYDPAKLIASVQGRVGLF